MPDSLAITRLLNHLFGGVVASAMHVVGISRQSGDGHQRHHALEILVVVGLIAFFIIVRLTLSVEKPNAPRSRLPK